jgi:hypothetical protein
VEGGVVGQKEGWGRKGGRRGRGMGRITQGGVQQLNNGTPSLIRWRLISSVERRESFGVRRGFGRRFGWF